MNNYDEYLYLKDTYNLFGEDANKYIKVDKEIEKNNSESIEKINSVEKVFCDCKKQYCNDPNPNNCSFNESGNIMDCCDNKQVDCSNYINKENVCNKNEENVRNKNEEKKIKKTLNNNNSKNFYQNLSTVGKVFFITGIIVTIITVILLFIHLEKQE